MKNPLEERLSLYEKIDSLNEGRGYDPIEEFKFRSEEDVERDLKSALPLVRRVDGKWSIRDPRSPIS